jgi:type III secretory pathway component EscV
LSFIWDTAGWGEGLYNVSAVAGPVPGELNAANNVKYAETGSTLLYINLVPEFPSLWIMILAIIIIIPTYYYIRERKKQRPTNSSKTSGKSKNIFTPPGNH